MVLTTPQFGKKSSIAVVNEEGELEKEEIAKRDKVNLDIFWLKDQSLEDSDDLPDPDVLAQEIADDLQTALDQFQSIADAVKEKWDSPFPLTHHSPALWAASTDPVNKTGLATCVFMGGVE